MVQRSWSDPTRIEVKLNANRMVVGTLRGFDQFMNLVIDNTVEVNGNENNDIGMVVSHAIPLSFCRGNKIFSFTNAYNSQGHVIDVAYNSVGYQRKQCGHCGSARAYCQTPMNADRLLVWLICIAAMSGRNDACKIISVGPTDY
ncbi:hypothetical protein RJ639_003282 [Escallonia herrerae]|uniref:Sm protein G n=1 Tax=Escallonia herrerae TaxID=1293975 RepID=A0AA88W564_9ASTE|nr:hypothetical protein RJ639_003282 [Escallonia herrerae]